MIYTLGSQLQTTDFTDSRASEEIIAKLRHDLTAATQMTCVLCMLHDHAGQEERNFYPSLRKFEPALVDEMLSEHSVIVKMLTGVAKVSDELLEASDPNERVTLGTRLVHDANEFFAYYLAHMNREEVRVVPASQRHFTDDQLRAIRGQIMASFTPEQMGAMLKWMLPALNVQELTDMFMGLKHGAPPPMFQGLVSSARAHVPPARWNVVAQRVGI